MMANISWLECRTEYFLLLLVASGLSILPPASCQYCNTKPGEPVIKISSTLPSNKLRFGATINLTCTAWQTNELAMRYPKTRPHRIEWFDPQSKRVGDECRAGSPAASLMNCTLIVGVLTEGKFGNYTCKASNGDNYCSTQRFQIGFQEVNQRSSTWSTVAFNCTVIGQLKPTVPWTATDSYSVEPNLNTTAMADDDKSLSSVLSSDWFIALFLPVMVGQL